MSLAAMPELAGAVVVVVVDVVVVADVVVVTAAVVVVAAFVDVVVAAVVVAPVAVVVVVTDAVVVAPAAVDVLGAFTVVVVTATVVVAPAAVVDVVDALGVFTVLSSPHPPKNTKPEIMEHLITRTNNLTGFCFIKNTSPKKDFVLMISATTLLHFCQHSFMLPHQKKLTSFPAGATPAPEGQPVTW